MKRNRIYVILHTLKGGFPLMNNKLIYIAGPCVIDKPEVTYDIAHALSDILGPFQDKIHFAFKASYDKASGPRHMAYRGIGMKHGLEVLSSIKQDFGFKITTDVHQTSDVGIVSEVVDILQVPALLCRQTDLVAECAKTGKTVNVKKGPFIAPRDMRHIIENIEYHGNKNIILTERGTCFGYDLVVDFRGIAQMKELGYPVIFDATHTSGGDFAPAMANAAMAVGADGLFTEVYPNPTRAKSDADNSLYLSEVETVIKTALDIRDVCSTQSDT
jgi:2-dehydro-3-deoxyphosphooctonate aldolase (KDO 8-P synthase)